MGRKYFAFQILVFIAVFISVYRSIISDTFFVANFIGFHRIEICIAIDWLRRELFNYHQLSVCASSQSTVDKINSQSQSHDRVA